MIPNNLPLHHLVILDLILPLIHAVASLPLRLEWIVKVVCDRVVIADAQPLYGGIILNEEFPETCLLRMNQVQQVLCRCQHLTILLGFHRNKIFLRCPFAARRFGFGLQLVNGLRYFTFDSELLDEESLEQVVGISHRRLARLRVATDCLC
jgi:hypothetical protein